MPAELLAASAQLRQIGPEARSDLSRLVAEAATLFDGGWHGPAALAFQRGWAQWFAGCADNDSTQVLAGVGGQF